MRASAASNAGSGSDNSRNAGSPIHSDRRGNGSNRDAGIMYGGEGGQYHRNRNNFQHQQEQPSQQQHHNHHQPLPASSTRDEQQWHTGSPQLPGFARNGDGGSGSGGDGGDDRDRKGYVYGARDGR